MATDNLNYYSAWLPAGQQTDRYSSQPWCLRSKNLDIFSSSKSVKATAWSEPSVAEADIISEEWGLVLKTDWKVYQRTTLWDVLIVDPSVNYPSSQISYNWKYWTYEDSVRWTPQSMSVATEWWSWKSFVVFTDRSSFVYSQTVLTPTKTVTASAWLTYEWIDADYWYKYSRPWSSGWPWTYKITIDSPKRAKMPLKIKWENTPWSRRKFQIQSITVTSIPKYYYDLAADDIAPESVTTQNLTWTWDILDWLYFDIDLVPNSVFEITITMESYKQWDWSDLWWYFYADFNGWPEEWHYMKINNVESDWDYNCYYNYLPIRERKLEEIWVYWYSMSYWMKWDTYQYLYKWVSSFVEWKTWTETIYDFVTDMGWANDPDMDVIWLIIWNEQVYMIWNLKWDGYIIPCDLTWWVWTPYIAYGCVFLWATNIDYLLYLVWENRWISALWVFNQQELVPVIWGNKENNINDIIDGDEQYKFDWKIVNWRKNLILSTKDNRIFQYGQTYGGKGWSFIHELPSNVTIIWLKANWNDLKVNYTITVEQTTTEYSITYQDDTPVKHYNTQWEAVYPIVLGNHLLEKEESDLFASYIIPDSTSKLEFWASANHYHFWTFKTDWNTVPTVWSLWDIDWVTNVGMFSTSRLEFVENNSWWLTFRLVWDMPVMSGLESNRLVFRWKNVQNYISYTEVNHFRKIWEITASKFEEWEFRFTNLNNKLELPKSHSLQVKVIWKWTVNFTPELFSLDLVANQRDRW